MLQNRLKLLNHLLVFFNVKFGVLYNNPLRLIVLTRLDLFRIYPLWGLSLPVRCFTLYINPSFFQIPRLVFVLSLSDLHSWVKFVEIQIEPVAFSAHIRSIAWLVCVDAGGVYFLKSYVIVVAIFTPVLTKMRLLQVQALGVLFFGLVCCVVTALALSFLILHSVLMRTVRDWSLLS